ncbi:MAG: hypothetical protein QOC89_6005, partial [Paraburkholderia sp.]|nr:hypothetical protein [Paraburkholderia sp.]
MADEEPGIFRWTTRHYSRARRFDAYIDILCAWRFSFEQTVVS